LACAVPGWQLSLRPAFGSTAGDLVVVVGGSIAGARVVDGLIVWGLVAVAG